jgi:hypothetical protein
MWGDGLVSMVTGREMQMRTGLVLSVLGLSAAVAGADPVNYEQIPADVVSYAHVDVERALSSRLSQTQITGRGTVEQSIETPDFWQGFGGSLKSVIMYALGKEGNPVLVLHGSAKKFHDEIEVPNSTDSVTIQYDHQEVHYSASCLLPGLFGSGKVASGNNARPQSGSFTIGLGGSGARFHGAFYTAYVGQDLIITALDLPTMAEALDVLHGKRPSLAQQDPQGLKANAPPGVIIIGAGLSAEWTGGNLSGRDKTTGDQAASTTRPVRVANSDFGMDLFGSFKGNARLAWFDLGENNQNDYAEVTFKMIDADSAEQLRNLLMGVKALVSLTQAQQRPLIDPLQIESAGNTAILQWTMPTTKLSEVIRQQAAAQNHDNALPTNAPATRPAP